MSAKHLDADQNVTDGLVDCKNMSEEQQIPPENINKSIANTVHTQRTIEYEDIVQSTNISLEADKESLNEEIVDQSVKTACYNLLENIQLKKSKESNTAIENVESIKEIDDKSIASVNTSIVSVDRNDNKEPSLGRYLDNVNNIIEVGNSTNNLKDNILGESSVSLDSENVETCNNWNKERIKETESSNNIEFQNKVYDIENGMDVDVKEACENNSNEELCMDVVKLDEKQEYSGKFQPAALNEISNEENMKEQELVDIDAVFSTCKDISIKEENKLLQVLDINVKFDESNQKNEQYIELNIETKQDIDSNTKNEQDMELNIKNEQDIDLNLKGDQDTSMKIELDIKNEPDNKFHIENEQDIDLNMENEHDIDLNIKNEQDINLNIESDHDTIELDIKNESYDNIRNEDVSELASFPLFTVRKDLESVINESDTQESNNEDDKMELRWDDDDECDINITAEEESNQTLNETLTSTASYLPLTQHSLNRPNVMLEIPSQDFSQFCDDDDDDGHSELTVNRKISSYVEIGVLGTFNKVDDFLPKTNQAEMLAEVKKEPANCSQHVPVLFSEKCLSNSEITSSYKQESSENSIAKKECKLVSSDLVENKLLEKTQDSNEEIKINTEVKNESQKDTLNVDKVQEMAVGDILQSSSTAERSVLLPPEILTKNVNQEGSEIRLINTVEKKIEKETLHISNEPQPSTSKHNNQYNTLENIPQDSNVVEMSDSLGLLAESSRVMEDDEEQDEEEDGDDDDDFDADDDNSNQLASEHSEESNAQQSEADAKEAKDNTPSASDKEISGDSMNFTICEVFTNADNNVQQIETKDSIVQNVHNEVEVEDNDTADNVKEPEETQKTVKLAKDIETVKLSDNSDTELETEKEESRASSPSEKNVDEIEEILDISEEDNPPVYRPESEKTDIFNINILDCVEVEESSSDDDVMEVDKEDSDTTVKMPAGIDVISSSASTTSDIVTNRTETLIKGLPKPPRLRPARLNTSEVTIKTANSTKDTTTKKPETKAKRSGGLEVFTLDSDDEEQTTRPKTESAPVSQEKTGAVIKICVNKKCESDPSLRYAIADQRVRAFYDGDTKRRFYVCENCNDAVVKKNQELIDGIKDFKPLLDLDFGKHHDDLVEISDSDSEEEPPSATDEADLIGASTAKFLEDNLTDAFNDMWRKFKMDDRLIETQTMLQEELKRLQTDCSELDKIFKECQNDTDMLRNDLYKTFEPPKTELPELTILDTSDSLHINSESEPNIQTRLSKRRASLATEPPAKRPAIPMGYSPLNVNASESDVQSSPLDKIDDDNTDISVVKLSMESAPADLPPPGPLNRGPLKVGMQVYAKKKASWLRANITELLPKQNDSFTPCRVKFEHKAIKDPYAIISGRCLAYFNPPDARMVIGTRVIALFKETATKESFSAGIVAEIPNPVNNYRYLIFFDDGYAQYAPHAQTRLVCECSPLVWEEVQPESRQFVKEYINSYPERPMVRLHAGQCLKTEYRGKWWTSKVERVDASLVYVVFDENQRREWIYRGSTRLAPLFRELQAAERTRSRALPRAQPTAKCNAPYVEYTRSNELSGKNPEMRPQISEEMRHQRSVAKKSVTARTAAAAPPGAIDNNTTTTSRVVYYTPRNTVRPHKMVPHECGPQCQRTDVLKLKDLRTYNPLAKPLLSGWERQVLRWKGNKEVMYVGGCGRRLRNMEELHRYLRATQSDMSVDLFDFSPHTHCLAEFVLNKCSIAKKDLSDGTENVPVPCVNYYDDVMPDFCTYNTERTPTAGVPLNLDPEFLCGCDCEDDCEDKSKCACWQLTLEGARTIRMEGDVGYVYKRLPKPLPSGIYECNSRCKCKHTCLNRVAQHPLQLKLQVFKTMNRGWGIRALNDIPEGSFLCVYAGNLLTDATANLDGLNEGDEYLAELDYIEVVEQMKEGYEEDIPKDIKQLDKEELGQSQSADESSSSSEDEVESKGEPDDDDDFQPGYVGLSETDYTKRLRKRDKNKDKDKKEDGDKAKTEIQEDKTGHNIDEECITISDDESREPSCFTAAAGMGANDFVPKYRSVRKLFGEDEACYIMDAKVRGNIGRYLNHSCCPNVFVQNVFVDTHDPRFPWVAFFALAHIKAGTELTWNYNYDVGSVPGKVLYCFCGAPNCRGRLL